MQKTIKFFIYCRKSTEGEDRQILSLPAQKKELQELAKKNNMEIVDIYSESQSAYKIGRPAFNEMLQRIDNGEANGILVWSLNRIARNALDGGMVIHMMDTEKILEIRTPGTTIRGTGNDKFILQIEFAMSKKTSDDNSESVKRGNREKLERGHALKCHAGYMFQEDPKTYERILFPDPERFELIRMAILEVLNGKQVSRVLEQLNNQWGYRSKRTHKMGGKPLSSSNLYKILNDDFYCGYIYLTSGERITGAHTPMITEMQFERLQKMLGSKGRPRAKHLTLPYRGIIFCDECGCTVCLDEKFQIICDHCKEKFSSRNKTKCPSCDRKIEDMVNPTRLHYLYARCTKKKRGIHCSQRSIRIDNLDPLIADFLESIYISPRLEEWLLKKITEKNNQEQLSYSVTHESIQKRFNECQKKLDSLLSSYTDPANINKDIISSEEYVQQKNKILEERKQFEVLLQDNQKSRDNGMSDIEEAFSFATRARREFEKGDFEQKTTVVRQIRSNLYYKNGEIRIDPDNLLLLLKDTNTKMKALTDDTLEPEKSIDLYEENGVETPIISLLQGRKESNLRQRFWRPLFYR